MQILSNEFIAALSWEIAERLFTNGSGQLAQRLVLELKDGKRGGGWSEPAAVQQIEKILREKVT